MNAKIYDENGNERADAEVIDTLVGFAETYIRTAARPLDTSNQKSSIGERLEKIRWDIGANKDEMAEIMGVSSRSYHDYESDKRAVPSDAIERLIEKAKINPARLFSDVDTYSNPISISQALIKTRAALEYLETEAPNLDQNLKWSIISAYVLSSSYHFGISTEVLDGILKTLEIS